MNDPGSSYSNPIWYDKWRIYVSDHWNLYNFDFMHDDYDGAPDSGDRRFGHGQTIEEIKQEIDEGDWK